MSAAKVYIVGAGPGSTDLITIGGLKAVKKAKVIICDSLLPKTFINELGINTDDRQIIFLKDENGRKSQQEINTMMLTAAKDGKTVVRLKVGDPHIFGRGMEELQFLSENGIQCQVVPGLTAATAVGTLLDLPITQRDAASSFAAVTARLAGGKLNESFPKADSLIIFMAIGILEKIVDKLINEGWPRNTPAVIIERASMIWQNQIEGELKNMASLAMQKSIQPPAILIIGKAARRHPAPANRPRILFTGLDPSNFSTMGQIIHWPAIQIVRIEKEYKRLPKIIEQLQNQYFGYVIFTSKTSVQLFFGGAKSLRFDSRILSSSKIIACGQGTSAMLEENGIIADYMPDNIGSDGIVKIAETQLPKNVLLVQSATAAEILANRLAVRLGRIERLCLHEVQPHPELGKQLPDHDVIYFTCPSGVRAYFEKYGVKAFQKEVWCIGDVTAKQLNDFNIRPKVVQP